MRTSPDQRPPQNGEQREHVARCLVEYLEQLPMSTEQRLELALSVLRELPAGTSPGLALETLHARLPELAPATFPPAHPAIVRSHMPAQYLGRPRTGLQGFLLQWGWVILAVGLLLGLTLLLNR